MTAHQRKAYIPTSKCNTTSKLNLKYNAASDQTFKLMHVIDWQSPFFTHLFGDFEQDRDLSDWSLEKDGNKIGMFVHIKS